MGCKWPRCHLFVLVAAAARSVGPPAIWPLRWRQVGARPPILQHQHIVLNFMQLLRLPYYESSSRETYNFSQLLQKSGGPWTAGRSSLGVVKVACPFTVASAALGPCSSNDRLLRPRTLASTSSSRPAHLPASQLQWMAARQQRRQQRRRRQHAAGTCCRGRSSLARLSARGSGARRRAQLGYSVRRGGQPRAAAGRAAGAERGPEFMWVPRLGLTCRSRRRHRLLCTAFPQSRLAFREMLRARQWLRSLPLPRLPGAPRRVRLRACCGTERGSHA